MVHANPPRPEDFRSVFVISRNRAMAEVKAGRRSLCEVMGLSVYTKESDAVTCSKQFPKLGKHIARLQPAGQSSRVAPTPGLFDSHLTWWVENGVDARSFVTVVLPVQ